MDIVDKLRNIPAVACTRNIEDTGYIMVGAVAREAAVEIGLLQRNMQVTENMLDEQSALAASRLEEIERLRKENAELLAAIENLIRVKGRHNTEIAYNRLVETYDSVKGAE